MKTSAILVEARRLLARPEKQAIGALRVNDNRCLLQAFYDTLPSPREATWEQVVDWSKKLIKAQEIMESAIGKEKLAIFNDTRTHSELLEAFDRAIQLAQVSGL
jgi:hypothetical protein